MLQFMSHDQLKIDGLYGTPWVSAFTPCRCVGYELIAKTLSITWVKTANPIPSIQGGPLSVINGVITPISRVITPLAHL